jgi:hypothetical protein
VRASAERRCAGRASCKRTPAPDEVRQWHCPGRMPLDGGADRCRNSPAERWSSVLRDVGPDSRPCRGGAGLRASPPTRCRISIRRVPASAERCGRSRNPNRRRTSTKQSSTSGSAGQFRAAMPTRCGGVRGRRRWKPATRSTTAAPDNHCRSGRRAVAHPDESGSLRWTQPLSCVRSSRASRTDASISTRLIETLSTLIPNGTPSLRQYAISSVAVVRAC